MAMKHKKVGLLTATLGLLLLSQPGQSLAVAAADASSSTSLLLFRPHDNKQALHPQAPSLLGRKIGNIPALTSRGGATSYANESGHATPQHLSLAQQRGGGGGKAAAGPSLRRALLAELLGTFFLVFFVTGSVLSAVVTNALQGLFQVAAVVAIGVTVPIACTATISGAHLNPSISVALAAVRDFEWSKVLPYCAAQVTGAALAAWLNLQLYATALRDYEVAHNIVRSSGNAIATAKCFGMYFSETVVSTGQAFLAEMAGTAMLAFVVFAFTNPKNEGGVKTAYIPSLIGLAVAGLVGVLAPLTQCGINPARDLGPRLVAYFGGWKQVAFQKAWVYWLAPLVGAPIGGWLADRVLFADD